MRTRVVWEQTYGGAGEDFDFSEDVPSSVIQTVDGGYALVGFAGPSAAGFDAWFVKTDASGNMEWNQTFGHSGDDGSCCVVQTDDGGYVLAAEKSKVGTNDYDFWLIKIEAEEDGTEPPPAGALPVEYIYVVVAAVVIVVVVIGIVAYGKRK